MASLRHKSPFVLRHSICPLADMSKLPLFVWSVCKKTFQGFFDGDSFSHAAAIAFSMIFSLPAILIIALSIGSTFYEKEVVHTELIGRLATIIGQESTHEIEDILKSAALDMSSSLARALGIGILLFSATTVFIALQSGLNNMWKIKPKPRKSWLKHIVNRLLSFAMVASFGFVLLVSLLMDTLLMIFQQFIVQLLDGFSRYFLAGIQLTISLSITSLVFALMFKVLPDAIIRWKDVWVGAFMTTLLFTFGKYFIGFYLGHSNFNSAYGAAGSVIILLAWVYYSTVIVLLGAEFTAVYAEARGHPIVPNADGVRFSIKEI